MVIIYKFYKDEIFIQPPGEHHLGDVRPKKVCATKKFHKRQNDRKGHIFEKLQKVNNGVTGTEKHRF